MAGYKKKINSLIPPVADLDFQKHREEIYQTLDTVVAPGLFGNVSLSSGTATVSNPMCSASSSVIATAQDDNSIGSIRVVCGSGSFTLKSSNAGDHGKVAWWLWP